MIREAIDPSSLLGKRRSNENPAEFAARVLRLIPVANNGKSLPILTREEEALALELIDAAMIYEMGAFDAAAQIVDNWHEAHA